MILSYILYKSFLDGKCCLALLWTGFDKSCVAPPCIVASHGVVRPPALEYMGHRNLVPPDFGTLGNCGNNV